MRRLKKPRSKPSRRRISPAVFRADRQQSRKSGLPPGTLVYVGDDIEAEVRVSIVRYSENQYCYSETLSGTDFSSFKIGPEVSWVHVEGLHRLDVIEAISSAFHLHPLVVEDIANSTQRPKFEDLGDYLFIAVKMLSYEKETGELSAEHLSLIIFKNVLLSFRERKGPEFDAIRERIRMGKGRVRKFGADYLAYCLIDTVVDYYFVILEDLAEKMELVEEELVTSPSPDTLQTIHKFKTDMIFLRRCVWPLREVIDLMLSSGSPLVSEGTGPYLRDIYDHTIHVSETLETYRDMVSGMLDIYLSSVSYKLNEIMKVLAIIATTFIPLTFMTGWYGMNFKHMPELDWPWAYYGFMGMVLVVAMTLLCFFRRRNWL